MPGLWKRMHELFTANSHAAIDNLENPAHMSQQLLRELDQELDSLRGQLVASLARQRKIEQSQSRLQQQCQLHQQRAHKAMQNGDEASARHQLSLHLKLQQELDQLTQLADKQSQWASGLREERAELLREREELSSQARLISLRSELSGHTSTAPRDAYSQSLQRRERMNRYSAQNDCGLEELLVAQNLRREELGDQPRDDDAAVDDALNQLKHDIEQENAA